MLCRACALSAFQSRQGWAPPCLEPLWPLVQFGGDYSPGIWFDFQRLHWDGWMDGESTSLVVGNSYLLPPEDHCLAGRAAEVGHMTG